MSLTAITLQGANEQPGLPWQYVSSHFRLFLLSPSHSIKLSKWLFFLFRFLLMIYGNTPAATSGLWLKQRRRKTPECTSWLGESKLKAAAAKNKMIQRSHVWARLYYCRRRHSIWEIWPQSWEEAVFATWAQADTLDGLKVAPSKHHLQPPMGLLFWGGCLFFSNFFTIS